MYGVLVIIALIGRLLDANIGDRNTKQILLTSTGP